MYKRLPMTYDAMISSGEPSKNYGALRQLYVMKTTIDSSGTFTLTEPMEKRSVFYISHGKIFNLLEDEGKNINDADVKVEIQYVISNWLVDDADFEVLAYPLSKPFYENYGHDLNSINEGVSWIRNSQIENWDNEGGDFDDSYDKIQVSMDDQNMQLNIDITEYLRDIDNSVISNNGIILIPSSTARNFAMYSRQSEYAIPYVNIFYDDYDINTGDKVSTFDVINEIPIIKCRLSNSLFTVNDTLEAQLIILKKYKRESYERTNKIQYLPNIKYRLVDKTRGRLLVDYRDETRVSVTPDGNFLLLDLENLLHGFYTISFKYKHPESKKSISESIDFRIEK